MVPRIGWYHVLFAAKWFADFGRSPLKWVDVRNLVTKCCSDEWMTCSLWPCFCYRVKNSDLRWCLNSVELRAFGGHELRLSRTAMVVRIQWKHAEGSNKTISFVCVDQNVGRYFWVRMCVCFFLSILFCLFYLFYEHLICLWSENQASSRSPLLCETKEVKLQ